MDTPNFKSAVQEIVGKELMQAGFEMERSRGTITFRGTIRDYPVTVTFESYAQLAMLGKKGFHFMLWARKGPVITSWALGSGSQFWTYNTADELASCVREARELLFSKGLRWLDDYTPGNVPQWSGHFAQFIEPQLREAGFGPREKAPPDVAIYETDQAGVHFEVHVNMRLPKNAEVVLVRQELPAGPEEIDQTLVATYSSADDLVVAIQDVGRYVQATLQRWRIQGLT